MSLKQKPKSASSSKKRSSPSSSSSGSKAASSGKITQLRRQYQPIARAVSSRRSRSDSAVVTDHFAFFPLLVLVFVIWFVYRRLFDYPVWFDESIGKAVFFGLPVFLYASITRSRAMVDTVDVKYLQSGLWMGLAMGGIIGFAGTFASLLRDGVVVQAASLFASDAFWFEFFLAILTGFWESLFFFSWIMVVIMEKFKNWPVLNQSLFAAFIFLAFHIPNTLLRFSLPAVGGQLVLLFFFALGQALIFARVRNVYALTMTHALWGMVLLIHSR